MGGTPFCKTTWAASERTDDFTGRPSANRANDFLRRAFGDELHATVGITDVSADRMKAE
jgi:hypothetical protein